MLKKNFDKFSKECHRLLKWERKLKQHHLRLHSLAPLLVGKSNSLLPSSSITKKKQNQKKNREQTKNFRKAAWYQPKSNAQDIGLQIKIAATLGRYLTRSPLFSAHSSDFIAVYYQLMYRILQIVLSFKSSYQLSLRIHCSCRNEWTLRRIMRVHRSNRECYTPKRS